MQGYLLPAGYQMTLVAGSLKGGSYSLFGVEPSGYAEVAAGTTVQVGPFATPKQYVLNDVTATNTPVLFYPTIASNLADIADDADGETIAIAVNGILAILLVNGLMEAGE